MWCRLTFEDWIFPREVLSDYKLEMRGREEEEASRGDGT